MARRPPPPTQKRRVWRITEAAPLGEVVDPDAPPPKPAEPAPSAEGSAAGGWIVSSFELRDGTEVDDGPDTVTDAQFDELFRPEPGPGTPPAGSADDDPPAADGRPAEPAGPKKP